MKGYASVRFIHLKEQPVAVTPQLVTRLH